jgi:integrase
MAQQLRTAPGMRERAPGVWELIVEAGKDPLTGKRQQVSRTFRGTLTEAKKARAALLTEIGKGHHTGARATLDELFDEWLVELARKGRSPNTIRGYEKCYVRNVRPTLGSTPVRQLSTKMLTDLYGAHQRRGLAPRSVYQIHACLSSMLSQACRWGWRDSNPAQWADPPSIPNRLPVVPTPEEVKVLIDAAQQSRRPEYARAMFVSATTGVRRAELCAIRRSRDVDWDRATLSVSQSILDLPGEDVREIPTKNRRERLVALDDFTLALLKRQVEVMEARAVEGGATLVEDSYIFSDSIDGAIPWKPNTITSYFRRLRHSVELDHLDFHHLRKFMETYGQVLGFSAVQVALRAGHDPSVAAKHYTGSVVETDRALAVAVASLLAPGGGSSVVRAPGS